MQIPAHRLKILRKYLGFTQDRIAKYCNVGRRTYISWEKNESEINYSRLLPLVEDFGLNLNWLLTGKGVMIVAEVNSVAIQYLRQELKKIDTSLQEMAAKDWSAADSDTDS